MVLIITNEIIPKNSGKAFVVKKNQIIKPMTIMGKTV